MQVMITYDGANKHSHIHSIKTEKILVRLLGLMNVLKPFSSAIPYRIGLALGDQTHVHTHQFIYR